MIKLPDMTYLVRSDALLAALSRRLDERLKGFEGVPDSVHNRAVRNAVQVVADCVAIAASDIRSEANARLDRQEEAR